MPELAIILNTDLSKGFTVPQVAEKHACPARPVECETYSSGVGPEDRTGGWTEPMVWSLALEGKGEACGPGRLPAQTIAHILYYFSDQNDQVFDPTKGIALK